MLRERFRKSLSTCMPCQTLSMTGELVMLNEQGKPLFEALRCRAVMTRKPPSVAQEAVAIFSFDVLFLAGEDLRSLPRIPHSA